MGEIFMILPCVRVRSVRTLAPHTYPLNKPDLARTFFTHYTNGMMGGEMIPLAKVALMAEIIVTKGSPVGTCWGSQVARKIESN